MHKAEDSVNLNERITKRYCATKKVLSNFEIPTVPSVLTELREVFSRKLVNSNDVARIIESNNVVTGDFLHIVNAGIVFKKPDFKIERVKDALEFAGVDNSALIDVVTTLAMKNAFPGERCNPRFQEMMDYSSDIAFLCKEIVEQMPEIKPHEAYMFGLFADVGYIMLNMIDARYFELFDLAKTKSELSLKKEIDLGADHACAGYIMARAWDLPNWLKGAILFHHEELEQVGVKLGPYVEDIVSVYRVATHIYNEIGLGKYITEVQRESFYKEVARLDLDHRFLAKVRREYLVYDGRGVA